MIRFDVELNGEPWCRAGIDGYGVISVMLHWMDFDGKAEPHDRDSFRKALSMSVSGFRAEKIFDYPNEQEPPAQTAIHWRDINAGLVVGDEIRIRIVEADEADEPTVTPTLPEPAPE